MYVGDFEIEMSTRRDFRMKLCMSQGCNMSQTDYDGRSALHLAAAEGHIECVKVQLHKILCLFLG